jgi:NH3-dependent NAD+ synthetase
MERRLTALVDWIQTTARPAQGLVLPVSGGSDSALCFWLCCQALPGRVTAVHAGTSLRARPWFESCGRVEVLPPAVGNPEDGEVMRWAMLLALSRQRGHWLVGTRNRTEEALGNYSLASRVATYLPLAGLWKSEVLAACQVVGVPAEVMDSSRRADPDCGRPAQLAEIPVERIDLFLRVKEGELPERELAALADGQRLYLERVYQSNQFKRGLPTRAPRV